MAAASACATDVQRVWHPELHLSFVAAVQQQGINKAVAKTVLTMMNAKRLTRVQVQSHLFEFKRRLRLQAGIAPGTPIPDTLVQQAYDEAAEKVLAEGGTLPSRQPLGDANVPRQPSQPQRATEFKGRSQQRAIEQQQQQQQQLNWHSGQKRAGEQVAFVGCVPEQDQGHTHEHDSDSTDTEDMSEGRELSSKTCLTVASSGQGAAKAKEVAQGETEGSAFGKEGGTTSGCEGKRSRGCGEGWDGQENRAGTGDGGELEGRGGKRQQVGGRERQQLGQGRSQGQEQQVEPLQVLQQRGRDTMLQLQQQGRSLHLRQQELRDEGGLAAQPPFLSGSRQARGQQPAMPQMPLMRSSAPCPPASSGQPLQQVEQQGRQLPMAPPATMYNMPLSPYPSPLMPPHHSRLLMGYPGYSLLLPPQLAMFASPYRALGTPGERGMQGAPNPMQMQGMGWPDAHLMPAWSSGAGGNVTPRGAITPRGGPSLNSQK